MQKINLKKVAARGKNEPMRFYLDAAKDIASQLYRINGKPIELSDGQAEIFAYIFFQLHHRVVTICCTQYGKSLSVSLGTLTRATTFAEEFTLIAPSEKKANINMKYVTGHAFDHDDIASQLEHSKDVKRRLTEERSKKRITFLKGGGVQILTLDAANGKRAFAAAMGFGSKRIIFDEAGLVSDSLEASVVRMLGGHSVDYYDTFLMKIGNPFFRNHLYTTWKDPRYHRIFIDYVRALKEGRFSPEFIEEMREKPLFDIYFECKFPAKESVDEKGYRYLISDEVLERAFVPDSQFPEFKGLKIGGDIGAGGDPTVYAGRKKRFLKILRKNKSRDTMAQIGELRSLLKETESDQDDVFLDDASVGRGITDRCEELEDLEFINPVTFGGKSSEPDKFKNMRAELLFRFADWIKRGGKLPESQRAEFQYMAEIKYKLDSSDRITIEPKDDIKKRIGKSTDEVDAGGLTFAPQPEEPELSVF